MTDQKWREAYSKWEKDNFHGISFSSPARDARIYCQEAFQAGRNSHMPQVDEGLVEKLELTAKTLLLAARWFKLNFDDETLAEHPPSHADLAGMYDAIQNTRPILAEAIAIVKKHSIKPELTNRESKLCAMIVKILQELEDNHTPWEGSYIWDSTEEEAKELLASCEYSVVSKNSS